VKATFIGNSASMLAAAADLALAGHDVRACRWPGGSPSPAFEQLERIGHVVLTGDPKHTVSGRVGVSRPVYAQDIASAVTGAAIVFLDMLPHDFEQHAEHLAPYLERGQIVHINSYSYWAALRLAPVLRQLGEGVILSEGSVPMLVAFEEAAAINIMLLRPNVPIGVFPASRTGVALTVLRQLYPSVIPAENVLETAFSNLNMLVHPVLHLLNIGPREMAEARGGLISLYAVGPTPGVGRLTEAIDRERRALCAAWGINWRSVTDYIGSFYGTTGNSFDEVVRGSSFYQDIPPQPGDIYRQWVLDDMPLAHRPMLAMADITGTAMPLQAGLLAFYGALFEQDFAADGLKPDNFGLAGAGRHEILHYVATGEI
jgi:opine dehydrogenase